MKRLPIRAEAGRGCPAVSPPARAGAELVVLSRARIPRSSDGQLTGIRPGRDQRVDGQPLPVAAGSTGAAPPDPHRREPDERLAARVAAGDGHALAEIFDTLGPAVYGGALRVLRDRVAAQDVVQDVFVELWCRPDRYNPSAGTLRTYLTVLARHRAVDLVRSELRRLARQERHRRLAPAGQLPPSPCDQVLSTEAAAVVRAAVRLLPDSQRRVVELAYFHGLTCREVAHVVGVPEGTAKSRLRLALARLEPVLDRRLLES